VFEEVRQGTARALLSQLEPDHLRGEVTLVVAGNEKAEGEVSMHGEIQAEIAHLLRGREMTVKDIAQKLSNETGIAYRLIYRAALAAKEGQPGPWD
jgi:16S rRNA C1402 (ribose-2'-O) methylase RsmI